MPRRAGTSGARRYKQHGASNTELWNLPDAPHAAALRTDPAGYEQHVIGFLDRSLL